MAIEETRIYELTSEQTTLTDTDLGVLDKSGYTQAKKFTMLNLYNYIKAKVDLVYQTILVSGTNIKTINGESVLGSGDLEVGGSDTNVYNTDGTLTGNRTISTADYSLALYNTNVSANHFKVSRRAGNTVFDIDTQGATPRLNFLALTGVYQQGSIVGENGLSFYTQGSPDGGVVPLILSTNNVQMPLLQSFATHGDADLALQSKELYKLTGDRTIYQIP